ncbi:MAG: FapA family protein [Firmicutes bacterium]|nr:FapA family protein [Bacillota bacterium]
MRRLLILIILLIVVACASTPARAAQFASRDNIRIPSDRTINDDFYVSGGTVVIDGTVNGDLTVAGGNITINGPVHGSLLVAGGGVILNGTVDRSVRAISGDLTINGQTEKDLVVAGGNVDISSGSTIGQDLVVTAGSARLSGMVARRLFGTGGNITIDGVVGDDARLDVNQLRLTGRAVINGDLSYTSENRAEISRGARIRGEITFNERPQRRQGIFPRMLSFLLAFLAALVSGIALLVLFPRRTVQIANTVAAASWQSPLLGFALLLVVPVAAILLFILIITIPLGIATLILYIFGIYLAKVFVGLAVGMVLSRLFNFKAGNILALFIGLLIVMLLGLIPFIGPVLRFLYIIFGLGAAVIVIYRAIGERREAMGKTAH